MPERKHSFLQEVFPNDVDDNDNDDNDVDDDNKTNVSNCYYHKIGDTNDYTMPL